MINDQKRVVILIQRVLTWLLRFPEDFFGLISVAIAPVLGNYLSIGRVGSVNSVSYVSIHNQNGVFPCKRK